MILDADPLVDIRNTGRIHAVVKGSEIVDRAAIARSRAHTRNDAASATREIVDHVIRRRGMVRNQAEMAYVDGFLVPVAKGKIAEYRRVAQKAGKVWMEHGALEFRECVGDDLDVGEMGRSFKDAAGLKRGETVMFSWIVYKSKAHRDRVNAKVMKDPRMDMDEKSMPFDVKRMCYGGFKVLVDL